jgi:hypothetical protein
VNEVVLQLVFAPDRVLAPAIQLGIWYSDPEDDVVPPVIVARWAEVEYAPAEEAPACCRAAIGAQEVLHG